MTCSKCHATADILYIGKPLCEDHYTKQIAKEMDQITIELIQKELNESY